MQIALNKKTAGLVDRRFIAFYVRFQTNRWPADRRFWRPDWQFPLRKPCKLLAAHRMLQLLDRLGFDLPHALARDLEDAAHLFQGVGVAVAQAVAQADDLPLAVGERLEQAFDLLPQQAIAGRRARGFRCRRPR